MKTKEQVIRYLSRRSYPDSDWADILSYCHERYGSGVRKSIRPVCDSTMREFMDWLDNGIGDGDIVSYNGSLWIFSDNANGTARIITYKKCNRIVTTSMEVSISDVTPAMCNEEYYLEMAQYGLMYSISLAQVCKRSMPPLNTMIKYSTNSETGLCIVKEIFNGMVITGCCVVGGQLFKDREYKLTEFEFSRIDKAGINRFHQVLSSNGAQWDSHNHILRKALGRSQKGKPYWFLTDKFSIAREIDNYTKISDIRYDNHNYFTTYLDAFMFRDFIYNYREGQILNSQDK